MTSRIAMWVQDWDYDSKAKCDAIITAATGHITDLFALVQKATNPKTLLGYTTLCHQTAITWDGKLPIEYLAEQAALHNIKVHAWFVIYYWSYWGGSSAALVTPLDDVPTGSDKDASGGSPYGVINYSNSAVRSTVIAAIHEFMDLNPGLAGINLDYIRTDGYVTGQTNADITAFVHELRDSCPAPIELSVCALSVYDADIHHQDVTTWLANNYIDTVAVMAYYTNMASKLWLWDQWDLDGHDLLVGIGTEVGGDGTLAVTRPSDNRATFRQYSENGYNNFALFCWGNDWNASERLSTLDDFLDGNIATEAPYPQISSVTVTPGTSFSLVIGGTTYTTTNASVSDHTTVASLKEHIEALQGQRPWIHYNRPTSSTISIQIGDWEL